MFNRSINKQTVSTLRDSCESGRKGNIKEQHKYSSCLSIQMRKPALVTSRNKNSSRVAQHHYYSKSQKNNFHLSIRFYNAFPREIKNIQNNSFMCKVKNILNCAWLRSVVVVVSIEYWVLSLLVLFCNRKPTTKLKQRNEQNQRASIISSYWRCLCQILNLHRRLDETSHLNTT